jgi:hypothetical protein
MLEVPSRRHHGERVMIERLKRVSGEVSVSVRDMAQDSIGSL